MTQERQAIHAYLSEESFEAWRILAEENGVSVTGILEAMGLMLKAELAVSDATEIQREWVKAGRKIDAIRRRRGRP
jgi:hypothetical protein